VTSDALPGLLSAMVPIFVMLFILVTGRGIWGMTSDMRRDYERYKAELAGEPEPEPTRNYDKLLPVTWPAVVAKRAYRRVRPAPPPRKSVMHGVSDLRSTSQLVRDDLAMAVEMWQKQVDAGVVRPSSLPLVHEFRDKAVLDSLVNEMENWPTNPPRPSRPSPTRPTTK